MPSDQDIPDPAKHASGHPPSGPGRPPAEHTGKRLRPVPQPCGQDAPDQPQSDAPAPLVPWGPPRPDLSRVCPTTPEPAWNGGQICGLFGIDIAEFTHPRRDEQVQLYLREMIYRILERAFDGSGMPWHACHHEDRGDGVLIIIPPGIPADSLGDPLPERLCGLIRVHNRLSAAAARIQLRAAGHIGMVYRDSHGFAGDAVNHLFRLLETPRLKHLLAATSRELAFIASDYFYTTVIRRHPTLVDPAAFQRVAVELKHGTRSTGWVQLLGAEQAAANLLPFDQPA